MIRWILGGVLALLLVAGGAAAYLWNFGTLTIDGLEGPLGGKGNSTNELSEIDLGREIPGMEGYRLRARYIVVKPGGIIRIHSHFGRPALSYIVNTPVEEYRSDHDGVILHRQGDLTADNDIGQWWRNTSTETAIWYVADIYKAGGNAGE